MKSFKLLSLNKNFSLAFNFSVFLVGARDYSQLQQFTHFMITAEAINKETNRATVAGPKRVGRFQLFGDALTKFYEQCVNTVAEKDDLPKTEVQVSFFGVYKMFLIDNIYEKNVIEEIFQFLEQIHSPTQCWINFRVWINLNLFHLNIFRPLQIETINFLT